MAIMIQCIGLEVCGMQVSQTSLSELIPYINNSRTHSDQQVSQIAASIKEFGFNNPILIDGDNGIIAGHGRVLAAQKLELEKVPTIELSHLTETQRKAYIIADNKLALNADWDMEMLSLEMGGLAQDGFDLSLIGFNEDELANIFVETTEGLTDPDEVPEVPDEPVTKEGDVWLLGKHRLMCGDSTSIDAVDKLMDGVKADMVFTDPPWNVDYGSNLANGKYKNRSILNDSMSVSDWRDFVSNISASLYSTTKHGALMYCVMSAQEWPVIDAGLRDSGFHWSSTVIWVKDSLVISRKDYHTQYEPIWYGWNDGGPRLMKVPDRKQSDIWHCKRPSRSPLHPTTKPLELIERAIENSSWRGAVVMDLFGGSGSTLMAAERTGRKARLMELDPKYCDVIVKRWQDFTGEQAELEGSGENFPSIKEAV